MTRAFSIVSVVLAIGCARDAKPDPRVGQLEADNKAQQQRVAELENKIDELERTNKAQANTIAELRGALNVARTGDGAAKSASAERIKTLHARVAELEKKLQAASRTRTRPRVRRRTGPDPKTVYAVPVAGVPYAGPKHAKITISMSFEFA